MKHVGRHMKTFFKQLLRSYRADFPCNNRNMSTFVSIINPVTGKTDWSLQNDDYDFHQEIARSAYADMLHDTERNQKYYSALRQAVGILRERGERIHVLDIGTGTGLLSMMAATLGADQVTACEAFSPMAECAKKGILQNGFADKIKLIPKRSTEILVGKDGDMESRANILITEVFDTELIGEGGIGTFTHAHKELLQNDCIVVPSVANMYVQPVRSDLVRRWRDILPIKMGGCDSINTPAELTNCGGAPSLHDLQLDQIPRDQFEVISAPIKVFRFDFSGKTPLPFENQSQNVVKSLTSGQVDGVFMWWDLEMDTQGEINLSCAPSWAHPNIEELQWRDHWMQAIYYPSIPLEVNKGEEVKVISYHDEYSLCFEVAKESSEKEDCHKEGGPVGSCGTHICFSRGRIGMMNDPVRRRIYEEILQKNVTSNTTCLCLGDGNIMALMAATLGCKKVFTVEANPSIRKVMESFIRKNGLGEVVTVLTKNPGALTPVDLGDCKVDLVLGEPYFQSSVLPWHNISHWYNIDQLSNILVDEAKIFPAAMTIKAMAVDFTDLWKIRAPVGMCEGFNLQVFDDLIERSSDIADETVEPQPLWEYPCTARSDVVDIYNFQYTSSWDETAVAVTKILNLQSEGRCNGVVLWADFDFGQNCVVSTGPREGSHVGKEVKWDIYTRQGVHLLKQPITSGSMGKDPEVKQAVHVTFNFRPKQGDLEFTFKSYS
ncbi:LOW QUALITY PROTEIN: protein arginine N-methyltransferase 7-like [Pecten maximus]|uniref:LOW QUALITY PROTEIN: protein arginine N-methyltransferase 7-like n=1 Tax=Pecten maximus TaxID=6579 RepID=UPI00145802E8|nr:LOW QUALITY PROTEIN: protein arginine N-methyltransferase 7-like [Pecten maximus]